MDQNIHNIFYLDKNCFLENDAHLKKSKFSRRTFLNLHKNKNKTLEHSKNKFICIHFYHQMNHMVTLCSDILSFMMKTLQQLK